MSLAGLEACSVARQHKLPRRQTNVISSSWYSGDSSSAGLFGRIFGEGTAFLLLLTNLALKFRVKDFF